MKINYYSKYKRKNYSYIKKTINVYKIIIPFIILFLSFSIIASIYLFLPYFEKLIDNLTLFKISKVEVIGNEKLSYEEIIRLSGIIPNKTLIFINQNVIKENLMKNEIIDQIIITKHYPDKLTIKITENKPFALLALLPENELYLMSENGKLYSKLKPNENINLPVITNVTKNDIINNTLLNPNTKILIDFLKYSTKDLRLLGYNNISQIKYINKSNIIVYTNDFSIPIFINSNNIKKDYQKIESILNYLYLKGLYQNTRKIVINTEKNIYYASIEDSYADKK